MIRITILISLITFFQACIDKRAPTKTEIVGIWTSTEGAMLEFKSDSTFTGKNLPSTIIHDSKIYSFDASGKWAIYSSRKSWDQQPWNIFLSITNADSGYIAATFLIVSGSGFMENKPPWKNLFFWVDEESGERYEFNKK